MFNSTRKVWIRKDTNSTTRKVWIRKDIVATPSQQRMTTSNWHIPQDGKKAHVRRLFTETIPFGRTFQALDSKSQLGYQGDDDTNESSDDDINLPKRRKIYYIGKIGGPIQTSPSYKYYTPASPYYCPSPSKEVEWPTFSYNPFKSDGETTDDDYDCDYDNTNNNSNKNNENSSNINNSSDDLSTDGV